MPGGGRWGWSNLSVFEGLASTSVGSTPDGAVGSTPPMAIVVAAFYTLRVLGQRFAQVDRMVELDAAGENAETARSAE